MKITSTPVDSIAYKSLRVSYKAEKGLRKVPPYVVATMLDVGRALEKTEYYDLEILSNLKLRIKEKGNPFSGLTEPIKILEPSPEESSIKVIGKYCGIESENNKRGDACNLSINYTTPEDAINAYNKISKSKIKFDRIGQIVKELDKSSIRQSAKENESVPKNKIQLYTVLMDKYADIVKEY